MQLRKGSSDTRQDVDECCRPVELHSRKELLDRPSPAVLLQWVMFTKQSTFSSVFQGSFQLIFVLVMLNHCSSTKILFDFFLRNSFFLGYAFTTVFLKYESKHTVPVMAISIHSLTTKCCDVTWNSCLLSLNFSLGKNSIKIYYVIYLKRCRYNPAMMIAIFGIKTVIQNSSMSYILTTAITINESKYSDSPTFTFILIMLCKTSVWECFTLVSITKNIPWKICIPRPQSKQNYR